MRTSSRFIPIAALVAVAAALGGCTFSRTVSVEPAVAPAAVVTPAPSVVTPPGSVIVTPSR